MNTEKKYIDKIVIDEIVSSDYYSSKFNLHIYKKKNKLILFSGSFLRYLDPCNKSSLFLLPILRGVELKNNDRDLLEKILEKKGLIEYNYCNLDKSNFQNHFINKLYFHQDVRHHFRLSLPWQFFKQLKKLFKIIGDDGKKRRLLSALSLRNNLSLKLKMPAFKYDLRDADLFVCKKKNWTGEIDLSLLLDNNEQILNYLTPDDYDAHRYSFLYEDSSGVYYVNVVKLISATTNVQHITSSVDFKSLRKNYYDKKKGFCRLSKGRKIYKEEEDSILLKDSHEKHLTTKRIERR